MRVSLAKPEGILEAFGKETHAAVVDTELTEVHLIDFDLKSITFDKSGLDLCLFFVCFHGILSFTYFNHKLCNE